MSRDDPLAWLRNFLQRFAKRGLPLRPRAWQTGCLSSGTFTPPSDIPVPTPPPVDWTWIPALWEQFWPGGGGGKPPNLGPVSSTDPSAKHVDRSHPAAANDPSGGQSTAPWVTIQYALDQLNPGDTLYIHKPGDSNPARVGLYEEHLLIDGRQGSAAQPFWVFADPGAHVNDLRSTEPGLRVRNSSYWLVQGLQLDGGGANARRNPGTGQIDQVIGVELAEASAVVIHACHVSGWTHAGISLVGSHSCIVSTCQVADNQRAEGEDCHGIQVLWDCRDTLVYGNTTHGNGGDGIQLQQGHEDSLLPGQIPKPPPGAEPQSTTILKNHFLGDGENGVDLKNCLRVAVQQNEFDGYIDDADIVVHCSANEVVIERNLIRNSGHGITVGAWNGRVGEISIRFNSVYRMTAGAHTSGTAIRVSHTRRADIYHNTLVALDKAKGSGVLLADIAISDTPSDRKPDDAAVDSAAVFNNIVVGAKHGLNYVLPIPGQAVGVRSLLSDYNLLYSCGNAIVAAFNPVLPGWVHDGVKYDCETRTTDPGLQNPAAGDFTPSSADAIDRAALLAYPPSWQQVCRSRPDIGAVEVCP